MMRVLHLNTQFSSIGGVEAALQCHHDLDAGAGVDSRFVAYWEPSVSGHPRADHLDFRREMTVGEARRRLKNVWPGFQPDVALHHTVWGQPYLMDLDRAPRRVLMLHSDIPGLERLAAARAASLDGWIAVSDVLLARARAAAPGLDADRFLRVDYPVRPPAWMRPRRDGVREGPLVLGFAGRLETEQKRVERFIELSAHLARCPVPWRLEFVGDGSQRGALEAALPDRIRPRFYGKLRGDDYWRVVTGWDAIVFTSDYEGTPIALIEALSAGVVPFHPSIGCGGDAYASAVDAELAYPPGDMQALAGRIAGFAGWTADRRGAAQTRAVSIASRHDAAGYVRAVNGFLGQLVQMPPLQKPQGRSWGFPFDRLTFAQYEWIAGLRG